MIHVRIITSREVQLREKARAVSLAGDRDYLDGLKAVALRRKVRVADLVREALDSSFGEEIRRAIKDSASFFAQSDTQAYQQFTEEKEGQDV